MTRVKGVEHTHMMTTFRYEGGVELINQTNLPLGTHYFPDPDGRPLGDIDFISLAFMVDGATLRLEVPIQKQPPFTWWCDVTPAGYSLPDDRTSAGPYTSVAGTPLVKIVDWERLWTGRFRIVIEPTGPVNSVIVWTEERFV